MRFSPMIDMAKDAEDVKKEVAENYGNPKASVPTYPYGLATSWDEETLEKLGMKDNLPEIGEEIVVCMRCRVTSVSENEREMSDGSKKRCSRVELQGIEIALPEDDPIEVAEADTKARRSRFYGETKAA
jgi:hypothetical protein